jgi:hypothetical protein
MKLKRQKNKSKRKKEISKKRGNNKERGKWKINKKRRRKKDRIKQKINKQNKKANNEAISRIFLVYFDFVLQSRFFYAGSTYY